MKSNSQLGQAFLLKKRWNGGGAAAAVAILGTCEAASVQERHHQTTMGPMEGNQDG